MKLEKLTDFILNAIFVTAFSILVVNIIILADREAGFYRTENWWTNLTENMTESERNFFVFFTERQSSICYYEDFYTKIGDLNFVIEPLDKHELEGLGYGKQIRMGWTLAQNDIHIMLPRKEHVSNYTYINSLITLNKIREYCAHEICHNLYPIEKYEHSFCYDYGHNNKNKHSEECSILINLLMNNHICEIENENIKSVNPD